MTVITSPTFEQYIKTIFGSQETACALYAVVQTDQIVHCEAEFKPLSNGESINPFLDNGVIKVGGRLVHGCSRSDDQRYLLLVSQRRKLVTLATHDAHKRTFHGGPTVIVAEMRRQFWVTQAMKNASACVKKCVTCFRFNSRPTQQHMGDLPFSRIEVAERAFSSLGLDFAGPLTFKNGNGCVKGYVAVFVCFASRAVHNVGCDGGSSETTHCKTRHSQLKCVRQCNKLRWCKAWRQRVGKSDSHKHTAALNGSSFLLTRPTSADYGKQRRSQWR